MSTTRASATWCPEARHRSMSSRMSRMSPAYGRTARVEAVEAVTGLGAKWDEASGFGGSHCGRPAPPRCGWSCRPAMRGRCRCTPSTSSPTETCGGPRCLSADVGDADLYAFRVDGPWAPAEGRRFDHTKVLIDPYALQVFTPPGDHVAARNNARFRGVDTGPTAPRGVLRRGPEPTALGHTARLGDEVVYETHVRGFTRRRRVRRRRASRHVRRTGRPPRPPVAARRDGDRAAARPRRRSR